MIITHFCVPGRAHSLGSESLLCTRQGEALAERQGCPPRGEIRRKPKAKRWPDEQKSHMRHACRMRRHISSKSHICTEGVYVDVAGISAKVNAHYPGRSTGLPRCGWLKFPSRVEAGGCGASSKNSTDGSVASFAVCCGVNGNAPLRE